MEIKIIEYNSPEYHKSVALRYEVLRKPLGLQFTDEFLKQDENQFIIAALDNNEILGVLLLQIVDQNTLKMRQVAVSPSLQGKGIGKKMVEFCENFARHKGYSKITMHARKTAVPFYQKLGYKIVGDEFIEVTIPHYFMEKYL